MAAVIIKKKDVERLGKEVLKEEELKNLKDKIENGTFTTDLIYHTLIDINLESEIDEDLSIKKEAFLEIYRVISYQYEYLEK